MHGSLPSQRCFGPYSNAPIKTRWNRPIYVRQCTNPAHGGHFVDTRTGTVLLCGAVYLRGKVPGPSHHVLCQDHGHVVNSNTQEVIG
jgi:hypothetical protein